MTRQELRMRNLKKSAVFFILISGVALWLMRPHMSAPQAAAQQSRVAEGLRWAAQAYRNGDYAGALDAYNRLLQMPEIPEYAADTHLGKGATFTKMGRIEEAAQEYRTIIERYPATQAAKQAQERLKYLRPTPPRITPTTVKTAGNAGGGTSGGVPPVLPEPPENPSPATGPLIAAGDLLATYQGRAMLENGLCTLTLTFRDEGQGQLSAYTAIGCMPLSTPSQAEIKKNPYWMVKRLQQGNPFSAVLTGGWRNDGRSLLFRVLTVSGGQKNPCSIKGDLTVTPFGSSQNLVAAWKEGCGDASIMVTKQPPGRGEH